MVRKSTWFLVYLMPQATGFRALDESNPIVVHALSRRLRSLSLAQRFVALRPWDEELVILRGVDDSMRTGTLFRMVTARLLRVSSTRSGSITWYAGDEL